jgi:hypothetical protein
MSKDDVPPEVIAELRRYAVVLVGTRTHVEAHQKLTPQWVDGSRAASEVALDDKFRDDHYKRPLYDTTGFMLASTIAVTDHLVGLARVLDPEEPLVWTPYTVARPVLELSARVWWLADPEIEPLERATRHFNRLLYSSWESANVGFTSVSGKEQSEVTDTLCEWGQANGLTVHRGDEYRPTYLGNTKPVSNTRLITDMLGDLGRGAYSMFSAPGHGTPSGIYGSVKAVDADGGYPELTLSTVRIILAASLLAFRDAFDRLVDHYGWDVSAWGSWRGQIEATLKPGIDALVANQKAQENSG